MATETNWIWSDLYGNYYSQKWEDNEWKTTWKDLGPHFTVRERAFYVPGLIYSRMLRDDIQVLELVTQQDMGLINVCELWYVHANVGMTGHFSEERLRGLFPVFGGSREVIPITIHRDVDVRWNDGLDRVGLQDLDGPVLTVRASIEHCMNDPKQMAREVAMLQADDAEKLNRMIDGQALMFESRYR